MTKAAILIAAQQAFESFTAQCSAVTEQHFFNKPSHKWSVAENVKHLIISVNTTTLAYTLPKFLVRWVSGKPNRPSKTYDELVAKYKKKLAEGGAASGRFVPKPLPVNLQKQQLITNWQEAGKKFITALQHGRSENDLDNYLVKHPLLGRITLRELCYFTIYHTQHHQQIIATTIAVPAA